MKVLQFSGAGCDRAQRFMDSYIGGELLVETNHELLSHLESCGACSADYQSRVRLRSGLRDAVRADEPPVDLAARIRTRLQQPRTRANWPVWVWSVVAASLALGVFAGLAVTDTATPVLALNIAAQEVKYLFVSRQADEAFRPGLADHMHCTVSRRYPDHFPGQDIGSAWASLTKIVRELAPEGYTLVQAHWCSRLGRRYMHYAYRDGNGRLASLVVSPKAEGPLPFLEAEAGRYRMAAFDAGGYSVWVVSDRADSGVRLLAARLREPVREFLGRM